MSITTDVALPSSAELREVLGVEGAAQIGYYDRSKALVSLHQAAQVISGAAHEMHKSEAAAQEQPLNADDVHALTESINFLRDSDKPLWQSAATALAEFLRDAAKTTDAQAALSSTNRDVQPVGDATMRINAQRATTRNPGKAA